MHAHFLQLDSQVNKGLVGVERADGINETALYMRLLLCFQGCSNSSLQVGNVVQCIEDTEHAYAVLGSLSYESTNYIVGIMVVAQQILAAEQHLNRGVQVCLEGIKTLPWILVQETEAGIIGSTAPGFQCVVTDLVQSGQHRKHLLCTHASCQQGLMSITQYGLGNFYRTKICCTSGHIKHLLK